MVEDKRLLEDFAEQVRAKFPEYSSHLAPIPIELSKSPYHEAIGISWPSDAERCRLSAYFRGDCFEVSFSVAGTRGPAEAQIYGESDDDPHTMVKNTVLFLEDFFSEQIVVAVERCRWLWFPPYYLPFFRSLSERPFGHRVSEVLSWKSTYNERRQT